MGGDPRKNFCFRSFTLIIEKSSKRAKGRGTHSVAEGGIKEVVVVVNVLDWYFGAPDLQGKTQ